MFDTVEKLHQSSIQHGPHNNRIYLMVLEPADVPQIIPALDVMAADKGYEKIFAKVQESVGQVFEQNGYIQEVRIPGFFMGREAVLFMSKYFSLKRQQETHGQQISDILALTREKSAKRNTGFTYPQNDITLCTPAEAVEMSKIYKQVFLTYPFPIHDPDYIIETMKTHVQYYAIRESGRMMALASSEMDTANSNVEMTDFATLPQFRGQGASVRLLDHMETEMRQQSMITAYTIARALSPGMNVTFKRMGYHFAGTLTNNTNVSGHIESMNVWHKNLRKSPGHGK